MMDECPICYDFMVGPKIFHSSYNHHTYEKIQDKMSLQISQLDLEFNWKRMDAIIGTANNAEDDR